MIQSILDLTYNLSMLVALSVISGFIRQRQGREAWGAVLQGLLFGGAALFGMMRPLTLGPGLIFDGRSVMLCLCGLFFGPLAVAIAGAMALLYRILLGGTGIVMGVSVILTSCLLGLVFHYRKSRGVSTQRLLALGVLVHAAMVLLMFTLPEGKRLETIRRVGLPVLLTYPLATLLIGKVLSDHESSIRSLAALQRSEETYRLAMEAASDGLWDWNLRTGEVNYSPAYFAMLGYAPGAFPAHFSTWQKLIHPQDRDRVEQANRDCIEATAPNIEVEFRMRAADGSWKHILGRGKCVARDEQGRALRLLGTHVDLTERKRAEEALRDSESRFRSYIENAPIGIFVCDELGHYREVNPAASAITGYSQEELLERGIMDILPPESHERASHLFMEVAKTGRTSAEFAFRRKDGSIGIWALEGVRLGPTRFMGLSIDITERLRLEEESRILQAKLQQAQTLESLGSLAGGVAHDMNNVLGAILGLATARLEVEPADSPSRGPFETISRAAERGGSMVKSLLSFARQTPAESRLLDLNAIIREEVRLLERTTLARTRLEMELAEDLHPVNGDGNALTHALMNLCVNAVDAMPDSGTLFLRTRNLPGGQVEVQVEDTGIGMPKDVLEKALDPFFTTKETGKGTGLGLSMAYSTVKAHQGEMELQSEPGKGTRVILRFPAADTPAPASAAADIPEQSPPGGAMRVLLVDDDELIQNSILAVLEALGHQATGVSSGEEALERLQAGLDVDVVILDLNMPGLGGAETLPRLRTLRPELPVLLATGRADQAAMDLAAGIPRVTLLSKPFGMKELQRLLEGPRGAAGSRGSGPEVGP